jgi:L-arabinose isomerase
MNRKPRAGLLPLYLKLYDDRSPKMREVLDPWLEQVETGLADQGVDVVRARTCRVKEEFDAAVAELEARGVDLLVTLHLAYSPSLESIDALTGTSLPLLMLDTTMDNDFGPDVDPGRLLYNHGIHGVQDLACMLRRRGQAFEIVAGHVSESNVLSRAADMVRAAHAARCLRQTRALRIGPPFRGMGDFAADDALLKQRLGISVTQIGAADLVPACEEITDAMVEAEMAADRERFATEAPEEVHRRSVRVGLGLRRCLDAEEAGAFSANFLAFDMPDGPVDTVPFLEISKAMARGIGYAGEGDVLTASLVGALLSAFERTTFTEIFCPDWKGDALFLSHMGEINPAVAAETPRLCEKDFPYTPTRNPAFLACAPAPGPAVLVNLAPGPDDSFRLIVCPVEVLGDGTHPAVQKMVRGWIRPACRVDRFLEIFSRFGGTHHSALVLGDHAEAIAAFARFADLECCVID